MDFRRWQDHFRRGRAGWVDELERCRRRIDTTTWVRAVARWDPEGATCLGDDRLLAGVPFLVKDLYDQEGVVSTASSRVLTEIGKRAVSDSAMVRALSDAGALPVGRTHMNEFAYGLDGFNAHTGDVPNPIDPARISGGSSSGSAWAVGAGIVPLALGTDTGGSIRVPAAFCGVYGFRRGVDHFAAEGVVPLAPSFDTAGWFTGTAGDMVVALDALWDRADATGPSALWWYAPASVKLSGEAEAAYNRFCTDLDAGPVPGRLQSLLDRGAEEARWAYNVIGSSEAYLYHREWLDRYRDRYSPAVWALIDRARHWDEDALERARAIRRAVSDTLEEVLDGCGAIVMPAVHGSAPAPGDVTVEYRTAILQLTCYASLAALPVLTIPLPVGERGSVGVQVVAREETIGAVARVLLEGA